MDRYIGDIIQDERNDTRNGDTDAIADSQILRYNQQAQNRLYGLITLSYNYAFENVIEVDIVSGTSIYTVNDNLAFGSRINQVEYSQTGLEKDYHDLPITPYRYQRYTGTGRPKFYRRRHNKVVVEPTPDVSQGKLRITYERAMDTLALRAATVNGTPSGTDIVFQGLSVLSATETYLGVAGNYVCISDLNGEVMLYNGVVASYDGGTYTLTLAADVDTYLVEGYTLADLDAGYLTLGKYTCTHSELPNEAEGYLIEYVNRRLHNVESSDQWAKTDKQLTEIKDTVVASYKMPDKARKVFPLHDSQMLLLDYD